MLIRLPGRKKYTTAQSEKQGVDFGAEKRDRSG
jgi:hypothetical protein